MYTFRFHGKHIKTKQKIKDESQKYHNHKIIVTIKQK